MNIDLSNGTLFKKKKITNDPILYKPIIKTKITNTKKATTMHSHNNYSEHSPTTINVNSNPFFTDLR